MARTVAELRAMTHEASAMVEEGQAMLRAAQEKFSEARMKYLGITEKLEPAAAQLLNVDSEIGTALAATFLAIDQANQYAAMI